ncbi:cyanophycinase [Ruegeria profundi]|uniref:cyanophycinase n=1 Tax=Ruegeria profundi TaxID=1685378 RepID=UPI001CD72245|nr:cyanophycinase [Ruegeria profundi]MCA0928400.1 cyanophycinase [Ruegeria profundi]
MTTTKNIIQMTGPMARRSIMAIGLAATAALAWMPAAPALADSNSGGGLLLVGGALRASNTAVYERFISMAGGVDTARIGVIPAASGKPYRNARKFLDEMAALGISEDRLILLPISVKDDSKTDEDESTWVDNGDNPEVVAQIDGLSAIWMIGGDQMRLRQTLLNAEGKARPAAEAMSRVLARGGVIGGTSAGAAIMSQAMIASGDSYSALTVGFADTYGSSAEQDYGPVWLDTGLGIFEHGVIDQHFDRQARYGRLVATTYKHRDTTPLGFGIEENTALVVTGNTAEVLGSGGVHVIDVRGAERSEDGSYDNVRVSFFQQGDGWTFGEGFVNTSGKYDTIGGDEYFQTPDPAVSGVFSRNATLKHFVSYDLVDNASASEVVTYLFNPRISDKGFELRFSQDENTKGYWKALDGQADSYAYTDVRLDITPVTVAISK